ncbi:MAG: Ribosomal RNA small subunit methyltransferase Nep1 [Candidatus Heimdallarchaeota archaeon LC_3]|nr:MAG: Ribosomal RNA small subunit methyltransferase Nep1 [Candidatus Heimdallarchaeota archaeon LC_3]
MTINIILFNSSLELTKNLGSKKLQHPVFVNDSKRRKNRKAGELLLDISIHYSGMSPDDRTNRGRPDIIHQIMLQYHFSLFNSEAFRKNTSFNPLRLFIHTNQDLVFEVSPEWRVPVSYIRFRGLMEKLLLEGSIEQPPVKVRNLSIEQLLKDKIKPESIILWTEIGEKKFSNELENEKDYLSTDKETVWLIGGYQSGDTPKRIESLVDKKLQIANFSLPSWKVLGNLLAYLEQDL